MAVLPIIKLGHPSLRKEAEEITTFDEDLKELVRNMVDTMRVNDGIGLAGPQVNILERIFVIDLEILDETTPAKAYINPVIEASSDERAEQEEGCLSIPRLSADVERPIAIKVRYQTEDGEQIEETLDGLVARVFQHEYDHLNGVLFIDHLSIITRKQMEPELNKIREQNSII